MAVSAAYVFCCSKRHRRATWEWLFFDSWKRDILRSRGEFYVQIALRDPRPCVRAGMGIRIVNSDGTINGAGDNRPGEPEDWEKTDTSDRRFKCASRPLPANVKIPMTFHHIMPWSRIWNGWNAVVASRSWDALSAWCYIMRVDVSDQIIERLKADPEQGMSAPLAGPETADDLLTKTTKGDSRNMPAILPIRCVPWVSLSSLLGRLHRSDFATTQKTMHPTAVG